MDGEEDHAVNGGFPTKQAILETRERVAVLEEGQEQLIESVDRVEQNVEEVRETVQHVDDKALDESDFADDYEGTIDTADTYITILQWAAGFVILIAAILEILAITAGVPSVL